MRSAVGAPAWLIVAGRRRPLLGRGLPRKMAINDVGLGTLPADGAAGPFGERLDAERVRRADDDLRRLAFLRIDREELRGLQPPLGIANLAGVEHIARPEAQAVEHDSLPRVREFASDVDVEAAGHLLFYLCNSQFTLFVADPKMTMPTLKANISAQIDIVMSGLVRNLPGRVRVSPNARLQAQGRNGRG